MASVVGCWICFSSMGVSMRREGPLYLCDITCPDDINWYEWYEDLDPELKYFALCRLGTVKSWMSGGPGTPTVETMTGMVACPELTDRELRLLLILKSVESEDLARDPQYMASIVPWEEDKEGMFALLGRVSEWMAAETEEALASMIEEEEEPDPTLSEDYNPKGCSVYFVSAGGMIKIGVSGNPDRRISELGRSSPLPLTTLAIITGGRNKEKALHKRFAKYRKHGEWFIECQEILDYVQEVHS